MVRVRVFAAGVAVAVLAVLSAAAPALAHDELVSSTPRSGAVLAGAPPAVELVFSGEVMTVGAVIVVADASGKDWVAGDLAITESTVAAALGPDMPDAGYEVRWRVVSGDGHPISGIIPFTIGDGAPLVREPAAAATDDAPEATGAQSPATPQNDVARLVLIGAGGAVLAIALFALSLLLHRRRVRPGGSGASAL